MNPRFEQYSLLNQRQSSVPDIELNPVYNNNNNNNVDSNPEPGAPPRRSSVLSTISSKRTISLFGYFIIGACFVLIISTIGFFSYSKIQQNSSSSSSYIPVIRPVKPGIPIRMIHSHNDYWRDYPLLRAISIGVQSVEADVWLTNDDEDLYVGHNWYSLRRSKRFLNMYIKPLEEILDMANTPPKLSNPVQETIHGVFGTDTSQTLYLFVDIKTHGIKTWDKVVDELQALRSKNYLTVWDGDKIIWGPITIIGTGNVPSEIIANLDYRDYFVDCPLGKINETWWANSTTCPIASGNFIDLIGRPNWNGMSDGHLNNAKSIIHDAHSIGIMTRFWNTPEWPVIIRNHLWNQFLKIGVDFLNADDLQAAIEF